MQKSGFSLVTVLFLIVGISVTLGGVAFNFVTEAKLQKSNDNFSSNIVDLPGCQFNFSADTVQNNDYFYKSCSPFFIIENLDSEYLRLVTRAYSTSNEVKLHRSNHFDGGGGVDVYYNPTLLVAEL